MMNTTCNRIRILILDDHTLVRRGLQMYIDSVPDMLVVGEAKVDKLAVLQARALRPDVILLVLFTPCQNGLHIATQIRQEHLQARILAVTHVTQDEKFLPLVETGTLNYLLINPSPKQLVKTIRHINAGKSIPGSTKIENESDKLNHFSNLPDIVTSLTQRELDVLKLVARGLSNREIANRLFIGERTVANHVSNILGELHLENRTQIALFALRHGLGHHNETVGQSPCQTSGSVPCD